MWCNASKFVPYLTSCLFLLWFSLSTLRNTSLVRLPSPPLPSGGNSGDGGSRGDKLPLEAPTESRDAPVSRRPPDSLLLSTVRWLPLWRRQTLISQRFTRWYWWGFSTDWLSWLPELPSQQVVDDVGVGLDQTHQDLLLKLCRNLERHEWRVIWAQVFFIFNLDTYGHLVTWAYREEPLVVLYEHQRYVDDGRAVLDAHGVDVRTRVWSSFPLQQVGPEDHRQVGRRHLVTSDLNGETRRKWRRKKMHELTISRCCGREI